MTKGENPDDVAEDLSVYDDPFDTDDSAPVIHRPSDGNFDSPLQMSPADPSEAPGDDGGATGSKESEIQEAMRYLKSGAPMPVAPNMAVPEPSHVGESQSNGLAERSIRSFVELFSCLKASLEARLRLTEPLPCLHPIVRWLVEHTAFVLGRNPIWQHSWERGAIPYC